MRAFAFVVAACAFACGHPAPPAAPPAPPPPAPAPAPTLADEVDALCACTSTACRTDVRAKFASVDQAADVAPHTLALRAYLKRCDAEAADAEDMKDMRAMSAAMCACKDAQCIDDVQKRYTDFMKRMEDKYRGSMKPSEEMMSIGEGMAKCMSDAMASGTAPSVPSDPPLPAWDGASTGVPACDAYLKAFDHYMACEKIPQEARDASAEGIRQMKAGWAMLNDPSVSREAKKAAGDACKQAVDALKQSAKAMGCPKP